MKQLAERRPGTWAIVMIALLLALTFAAPVWLMRGKSITSDEVSHLPAGYAYLRTGLITLNPMHPPLIKELCALPLLLLGELEMPLGREELARSDLPLETQWAFGRRFLYRHDVDRLLFWGRLPAVALSLGLASLVTGWAWRLWGAGGAVVTLALYAFDPTITAHAQLVTTDVGVGFFTLAFLLALRRHLDRPSASRLLLAGVTLGFALGAKFSAVLLVPIAAILMTLGRWQGDGSRARRLASAVGELVAAGAIAWVVLWTIYFFPSDPLFYVRALFTVNADRVPHHHYFLMGTFEPGGWPYYLAVAGLVKMPLAGLILIGAAAVFFVRGARARALDEAFLVVPAVILFASYSLFTDALGFRYLIPCLPFLFVFAGRIGRHLADRRIKAGVAALLAWQAVEFASIWPDHLAYFNQIAGGPRGGLAWLDDSNVDWGQGVKQLRNWLDEQPIERYRLCTFEHFDPRYYGVDGELIGLNELVFSPPRPSTLVLSAHCVARVQGWLRHFAAEGLEDWMQGLEPRAIVGHAYYVYELGDAETGRDAETSRSTPSNAPATTPAS